MLRICAETLEPHEHQPLEHCCSLLVRFLPVYGDKTSSLTSQCATTLCAMFSQLSRFGRAEADVPAASLMLAVFAAQPYGQLGRPTPDVPLNEDCTEINPAPLFTTVSPRRRVPPVSIWLGCLPRPFADNRDPKSKHESRCPPRLSTFDRQQRDHSRLPTTF